MELVGSTYGGYLLPSDIKKYVNENSLVISAGIGHDTTFDWLLHEMTNCKIIMIDPSDIAVDHLSYKKYSWSIFYKMALNIYKRDIELYKPTDERYTSLSINNTGEKIIAQSITIIELLNNNHEIDLLKIDIEGMELPIISNMINVNKIYPKIICVEIHAESEKQIIIDILTEKNYHFERLNDTFTFVLNNAV